MAKTAENPAYRSYRLAVTTEWARFISKRYGWKPGSGRRGELLRLTDDLGVAYDTWQKYLRGVASPNPGRKNPKYGQPGESRYHPGRHDQLTKQAERLGLTQLVIDTQAAERFRKAHTDARRAVSKATSWPEKAAALKSLLETCDLPSAASALPGHCHRLLTEEQWLEAERAEQQERETEAAETRLREEADLQWSLERATELESEAQRLVEEARQIRELWSAQRDDQDRHNSATVIQLHPTTTKRSK